VPITYSPLRYPGGKSQLTSFVIELLRDNDLFNGTYVEPYAGGAGIAWKLLLDHYVTHVHINDIDPSIYAFWACVIRRTDDLCDLIANTDVTIEEWHKQKLIQSNKRSRQLELAFSTFFLNRTNRSGIIGAGVIGGKEQLSKYPLDCRYNKENLIAKIRRIAKYKDQITLTKLDGICLLRSMSRRKNQTALVNIDPPYYLRGRELYCSFYEHSDHVRLFKAVKRLVIPWMLTYDDSAAIRAMYIDSTLFTKSLNYSAQRKHVGTELMVFHPQLKHTRLLESIDPKWKITKVTGAA